MRILAVCVVLMTACYSPDQPACGFPCGSLGECPSGYFCAADNICHRNGTPSTMTCGPDAMPDTPRPIDAPPPDADQQAPQLIVMMPGPFETNVPVTSTVYVQFNEPVQGITTSSFYLTTTSMVAGTVSTIDARTYVFAPTASLPPNTTITVTLTNIITDQFGNPFIQTSYTFTTAP